MDKVKAALLRVISGLWETYEWVPVREIVKRVPWSELKVKAKIREMEKEKLVAWRKDVMKEPAVRITEKGMDSIAIWDFMNNGVIDRVGGIIGEGKEAVVLLAEKEGRRYAIKLHRYYSAEFRRIKRSLSYAVIRWWKRRIRRVYRPVDVVRAKAQVEYYVLKKLHGHVNVPEPVAINRHAVVMSFIGEDIPAPLLAEVEVEEWMKEEVMKNYEKTLKLGIVHGDMSEYNVMVWDKCYLIDWPQAVPRDFEGAEELIRRDMKNLERFFRRAQLSSSSESR